MSRDLRLRFVLDALDRVSQPLRAITEGSSKTAKALRETRDEMRSMETQQRKIAVFKDQQKGLADYHSALDEARRQQRSLRLELESTATPSKKLSQAYERATRRVETLELRSTEQVRTLQRLQGELKEAGIDTSQLARHEQALAGKISQTTRRLTERQAAMDRATAAQGKYQQRQEFASKLQSGGGAAMAMGAAATAPSFLAARSAMSFEDALADANKVLNLTNDELAGMKQETLELSKRVPLTPQQLMVIKAAGAEARIAKDELGSFAEDAAKMAIAFNMSAEEAGAQMAAWRTSFSLSQDGVRELADQINALTNKMGGNTGAISAIISRIGPLGQVAGLAGGQIAAMAATLDTVQVPAEVAGTGIKNLLLAMTKGSAATKTQSEAFKKLGLSTTGLAKRMQTDATGAITDVLTRISQLKGEDQTAILTQLFGSESVTAIAPLLTNLDDLKKRLELVGDASAYTDSMTEEFLARMGTTSAQLQLASNRVEVMKVKLGDRLLPLVVKAADRIGALADRVSAWADRNPKLTGTLMMLAGILGPLLIGLGVLGITAGVVSKGWATLAYGFSKIAPLFGPVFSGLKMIAAGIRIVGMVVATNPILLTIMAIAGAVYLIYRNWDTIGPWVQGLWNRVTAFFQSGIGNIISVLADFSPIGILYQGFAKLLNWLGIDIPDKLSTAGKDVLMGLWKGLWGQKDWLVAKLKKLAELIPAPIRKALGIKSPSRVFMGIGGDIMDGLDEGLGDGARNPLARVSDLSGQLARAMAVGATAPALLAASPAAAGLAPVTAPTAASASVGGNTFNFHISGSNAQDIAREVRRTLEQMDRERAGRTFGDR